VNRAFCAELRRPAEQIVGLSDQDLYPEELARKYAADDQAVIASGSLFEAIEEHVNPEGEHSWVQVVKGPLRDALGRGSGMQGVFWDVTARRRAEMELARAVADIAVARRVQQKLYPGPACPLSQAAAERGFDLGGASFPAEAVGGDYFDFFPLAGGVG